MSHDWGYKEAMKHAASMGLTNKPSRVAVKPHTRAPRMVKAPPAPMPAAQSSPMPAYAKGGPVKKHDDAKQDAAQIKSMVKADCMKAKGGVVRKYAQGGKVVKNPSPLGPDKELDAIQDMERVKAQGKAYGFEGKTVGQIVKEKNDRDYRIRELKSQKDDDDGYAKGGPVKKNWIAAATKNKGGLHKSLGIAAGKKIPAKTLAKAATKGGKVGKQARLAETLKSFKK